LVRDEGLLVGGSSGTNVVAALRVAATLTVDDGPVVTVLPDSWDRYRAQPWMDAWMRDPLPGAGAPALPRDR
jgi:hypothetical protein